MKNSLQRSNLFVISGPSGSGQDTVIEGLRKRGWDIIRPITTTSRKMRPEEKEGKPYFFISPGEFKKKIAAKEFLEWAWVYNDYKGTTKKEMDRVFQIKKLVVWKLDYQGALNAKKIFPEATTIFIKPGSMDELKKRLLGRGDGEKIFFERQEYTKEYFLHEKDFDYVIQNEQEKLKEAVDELERIIRFETKA